MRVDEVIWFLRQILLTIRQRSGGSCRDCRYFGLLAEYGLKQVEPSQFESPVPFDEERYRRLSAELKNLCHRAADEARGMASEQ
jgi:hypothetical protein